jgi:hypothetical protein
MVIYTEARTREVIEHSVSSHIRLSGGSKEIMGNS